MQTSQKQAQADIIAIRASVDQSQLNFSYTHITASIDGSVGQRAVL
ncbi:multidrug resistance A domain protein [Candidatus Erwinia dacicola]|uniref:Multidrug resistance A domain protein n=1 Tax=Candidatus Erwinia dacicola TaxID=252393 RepID=A0A328TJF1_9GAMM|nr:multidrug resistance A domain protein [Candidatus Erwinia dacicola]